MQGGGTSEASQNHQNKSILVILLILLGFVAQNNESARSDKDRRQDVKSRGIHSLSQNINRVYTGTTHRSVNNQSGILNSVVRSVWSTAPDPTLELCRPVAKLLTSAETSGNPPLNAIFIGNRKNPGKNGIGDRMKGVIQAAWVAVGLNRPFRMYLSPSIWNVSGTIEPVSDSPPFIRDYRNWKHDSATANNKVGAPTFYKGFPAIDNTRALQKWNDATFGLEIYVEMVAQGFGNDTPKAAKESLASALGVTLSNSIRHGNGQDVKDMCMFRSLFRASKSMVNAINDILTSASTDANKLESKKATNIIAPSILGIHARHSNEKNVGRRMHIRDVEDLLHCAVNVSQFWASQTAARSIIWLIASDAPEIVFPKARAEAKSKRNKLAIGVGTAASEHVLIKHIKSSQAISQVFRLWLDWFLLVSLFCRIVYSSAPVRFWCGSKFHTYPAG